MRGIYLSFAFTTESMLRMFSLQFFFNSIVLVCILSQVKAYEEYKVIGTSNGEVRGRRNTTLLKNVPYYSFKGIPYAKPPIDDLRFKVSYGLHFFK